MLHYYDMQSVDALQKWLTVSLSSLRFSYVRVDKNVKKLQHACYKSTRFCPCCVSHAASHISRLKYRNIMQTPRYAASIESGSQLAPLSPGLLKQDGPQSREVALLACRQRSLESASPWLFLRSLMPRLPIRLVQL